MDEVEKFFENTQLEIQREQEKLSRTELSAKSDLLKYVSSSIQSAQKEDEIELTLESTLLQRLQDPDVVNEIPTGSLLKGLIELKRLRIERETGILAVLSQKGFVINQQFNNGKSESEKEQKVKKEEPISKSEFESAKKMYDLIQGIKDAEVNLGEENV